MILLKKYTHIKGFTLIEVLASILILTGLIAIVVQISYGNTQRMKKAKQLEKIAYLLEIKMLELEQQLKLDGNISGSGEGDFKNEDNYFWSYETKPFVLPNPQVLLSLVQIPEDNLNMRMAQVLTDVFSKSIVELKLTVHYRGKRGKELQYSLVSYFVNYKYVPDFVAQNIRKFIPENTLGL